MKLRPVVQRFAEEMERRLRKNDHKGGWDDCGWDYLRTRLLDELEELNAAWHRPQTERAVAQITHEAADLANFAMMVADNFGNLSKGEEGETP